MKREFPSLEVAQCPHLDRWRGTGMCHPTSKLIANEMDLTGPDDFLVICNSATKEVSGGCNDINLCCRRITNISGDLHVTFHQKGGGVYSRAGAAIELHSGDVGIDDVERGVFVIDPALRPLVAAYLRSLAELPSLNAAQADPGVRASRLRALLRHLDDNYADPGLDPTAVAASFGISVRYLHKLLASTGVTFAEHLTRRRLNAARTLLADRGSQRTITDIAFAAGFNDLSSFGRQFKARFGLTPRGYRAGMMALR